MSQSDSQYSEEDDKESLFLFGQPEMTAAAAEEESQKEFDF
jgi:hypothetical protein